MSRRRMSGPISARYGPPTLRLPPDYRAKRMVRLRATPVLALIALAASGALSEAIAATFGFPRAFAPWIWHAPLYVPWAAWQWLYSFAQRPVPPALRTDVLLAFVYAAGMIAVTVVVGLSLWRRINDGIERPYDLEGSSHWATPAEITNTGFVDSDPEKPGIYIGEWVDPRTGRRKWLRDTSDRHVFLAAPTRSGKGVSVLVPTLLTWSGSIVANDPKGELYELTAAARKALGQYAIKHDPVCADGTAAKFNALEEIRTGTVYDIADAQQIALYLVDPLGQGLQTGGDNDHWRMVAWGFLVGAILHIVYAPQQRDRSLHGLDAFIDSGVRTEDQVLEEMLTTEHDPTYRYGWVDEKNRLTKTHPIVAAAARAMLNRPASERGSAMSSAKSYTSLYKEEVVAENTASSDFSIDDIMHNPAGVSLYLTNTPESMVRLRGHMRMIVNLINSRFTGKVDFDWDAGRRGRQKQNFAHPLLFAQDEFTSTHGRLDTFANALAFHAGYGIRCLIVAQDYSQLEGTYEDSGAQAILSNMHTQIYYATNNPKTASAIEGMVGAMTVYDEQVSVTKGVHTVSRQLKKRPLITSSEFMQMDEDDGIAIVAGQPPMYLRKIRYFKERAFANLVARPPAVCDRIPLESRAMTQRLAKLRADNDERIARRRAAADGYAPPNENPNAAFAGIEIPEVAPVERPRRSFDAALDLSELFSDDGGTAA